MDTSTVDVPFPLPVRFIPDFVTGMAQELNVAEPTTDEGKIALYQAWAKVKAKQCILNVRTQRAATLASVNDSDGLLSW